MEQASGQRTEGDAVIVAGPTCSGKSALALALALALDGVVINADSMQVYRDLRVRTGYVYNVESQLDWTRDRSIYNASFGADPDKVSRARGALVADIKDLQNNAVGGVELNRAKAQLLRRLPMQSASVDGLAALDLRFIDLNIPLDTPQIAAQHFYDVTSDQVKAAFVKYLRPDDLAQVVKGPQVTQ